MATGGRRADNKNVDVFLNVIFVLVCSLAWSVYRTTRSAADDHRNVQAWLVKHRVVRYAAALELAGVTKLEEALSTDYLQDKRFQSLPSSVQLDLQNAAVAHKDYLVLEKWLSENHLQAYLSRLSGMAILSLDTISAKSKRELELISSSGIEPALRSKFQKEVTMLKENIDSLHKLKQSYFETIKHDFKAQRWSFSGMVLFTLIVILLMKVLKFNFYGILEKRKVTKKSLVQYATLSYVAPQSTKIYWGWQGDATVGKTLSFKLQFYRRNGIGYCISKDDCLLVEVVNGNTRLPVNISFPSKQAKGQDRYLVSITFAVHMAGSYKISVMLNAIHIPGSPFTAKVKPGAIEPRNTHFVQQSAINVCTKGKIHCMNLEPRDQYDNLCEPSRALNLQLFSLKVTQCENGAPYFPKCELREDEQSQRLMFCVEFDQEGCYQVEATYDSHALKNGIFHMLVLSQSDVDYVNKTVSKKSHSTYYEGRLVSYDNTHLDKPKRVYCFISAKQLTIKEYFMKIFPKRLLTFRVCPSTKFQFLGRNNQYDLPVMVIEDGCQPPVTLILKARDTMAAIFTRFLLKNIGGSETFKEKQEFFHNEVRNLHSKRSHACISIKVNRNNLLESAYRATKGFTTSDWCRNFEITFIGEEGLDWGGLRREFFELVCQSIFDPNQSGLFIRFKDDDPQALVHPNHSIPPQYKLKYYEYAGKVVGKCLYESSLGSGYTQLVKARLSRSFFAQLIGLRVNYKYFIYDDPELYVTKIKYILENDVDDMDLYFEEERYRNGRLEKNVELIPGGSQTLVTESNKLQYLDALAQYRLSISVKPQIEAFLKGLNDLIPDNLLSMFDENELELLMCGTSNYDVSEFKKHHTVHWPSQQFSQTLEWFWIIVSSFTQNDLGRLLQFTTGSSLLPPGGFAKLTPNFQITLVASRGSLPTAHTCFNQLCLPAYDSMDQMHEALMLAITEGSQGFCMI